VREHGWGPDAARGRWANLLELMIEDWWVVGRSGVGMEQKGLGRQIDRSIQC
jgi:hypothetical protein